MLDTLVGYLLHPFFVAPSWPDEISPHSLGQAAGGGLCTLFSLMSGVYPLASRISGTEWPNYTIISYINHFLPIQNIAMQIPRWLDPILSQWWSGGYSRLGKGIRMYTSSRKGQKNISRFTQAVASKHSGRTDTWKSIAIYPLGESYKAKWTTKIPWFIGY